MAKAEGASKNQFCRHYARGRCTGCTRLHVPYATQLRDKQAQVANALSAVAPGRAIAEIAASPRTMGYRTSVKWCLHEDREGRKAIGLYRQGSREVVAIPDCPATAAPITDLIAKLFRKGLRPAGRFYDHRGRVFQRGRLKSLIVRFGPPKGIGAIIVHTGIDESDLRAWIKKADMPDVTFYESRLTAGDRDELMGRQVRHLAGAEYFPFTIAAQRFDISPESFFQANFSLSGDLVKAATTFDTAGDVMLDLYGGFGAYSFQLLERFKEVYVVDGNPAAIAAAKRAAKGRNVEHLKAHSGMCEHFLRDLAPDIAKRVTHMIVNPPRNGLSRTVIDALQKTQFPALREINYISCNPETLARDLAAMSKDGWQVAAARPFDMFPQTEHVETVAALRRSIS